MPRNRFKPSKGRQFKGFVYFFWNFQNILYFPIKLMSFRSTKVRFSLLECMENCILNFFENPNYTPWTTFETLLMLRKLNFHSQAPISICISGNCFGPSIYFWWRHILYSWIIQGRELENYILERHIPEPEIHIPEIHTVYRICSRMTSHRMVKS